MIKTSPNDLPDINGESYLLKSQQLFGVSCLATAGGSVWCVAAAEATAAAGPCLSGQVCVSAVDNALWVTRDDGGLTAATAAAGTSSHV